MHDGVEDTWASRDMPLLRIAVREVEAGRNPEFEQLADETGLEKQQVWVGVRALRDAGYVEAYFAGAMSGFINTVSERARRTVGSWPSADTIVDELARGLAKAAEREADDGRRSWLKSAASGMAGVGRSLITAELEGILRRYGVLL